MNIREKVLIVEDEKGISQFIAAALTPAGAMRPSRPTPGRRP